MNQPALTLLSWLVVLTSLLGCGSSDREAYDQVSEAVTPATVVLYVAAGTMVSPTQLAVDLNKDSSPVHLSTFDSAHVAKHGTEGLDVYRLSTLHASLFLSDSLWASMATKLNTAGHQVRVTLTYDSAAVNAAKPLIGLPVFDLL